MLGDRSGWSYGKGFRSPRPRAPHLERDLAGSDGDSLCDQRPDLVDSLRPLLVRYLACLPEETANGIEVICFLGPSRARSCGQFRLRSEALDQPYTKDGDKYSGEKSPVGTFWIDAQKV